MSAGRRTLWVVALGSGLCWAWMWSDGPRQAARGQAAETLEREAREAPSQAREPARAPASGAAVERPQAPAGPAPEAIARHMAPAPEATASHGNGPRPRPPRRLVEGDPLWDIWQAEEAEPQVADAREDALHTLFESAGAPTALRLAECRRTLCRIEISLPDVSEPARRSLAGRVGQEVAIISIDEQLLSAFIPLADDGRLPPG